MRVDAADYRRGSRCIPAAEVSLNLGLFRNEQIQLVPGLRKLAGPDGGQAVEPGLQRVDIPDLDHLDLIQPNDGMGKRHIAHA